MESLLTTIANYLWTQSWQIALLAVAVGLASWALCEIAARTCGTCSGCSYWPSA